MAQIVVGLLFLILGHHLLSRITDWGFGTRSIALCLVGAFAMCLLGKILGNSDGNENDGKKDS